MRLAAQRLTLITGAFVLFASSAAAQPCPADLTGDGMVNSADLGGVLGQWGPCPGCPADFSMNGSVGSEDLGVLLGSWGPCPEATDFRGDPNPHEPGEHEYAAPSMDGGCGDDEWIRSHVDGWVNGVYMFSGEAYQRAVDLRIPGRMLDFVWARRYRSQTERESALGYGWDYSYNIYVQADGADLLLHNGDGRVDRYEPTGGGEWTTADYFRVIEQLGDGRYEVVFPDTGRWVLASLNGSAAEGKIESIIDRNGNTMSFTYDGQGRLVGVTDDLNRNYTISYNIDGRIESLEDFAGCEVRYEYYGPGDPDGADGDLKSVRSPIVTGTPNGNDFPNGKTTTYTYTTGAADDALNHNLLSITNGEGETWLTYEYAATTDGSELFYDRAVAQEWGDPGDRIDLHYEAVTPDSSNGGADFVAVINDRRGLVKEVYSNANRLVACREFTGFADPDLATTLNDNRPTNPIQPTDPTFYLTSNEHNADGLLSTITHPELNQTQYEYDSTNASRRSQGNMLVRRLLPGPRGGDQADIVEMWEYATGFGGCCGTNFVTRHVDARGNETTHTYDASGNRLSTTHRIPSIVEDWEYNQFGQVTAHIHPDNGDGHRRRDEFEYFATGPSMGYLACETVDATGEVIETGYIYNVRGAATRIFDPLGQDTIYRRNDLDQIVREESREISTPNGSVRYIRDYFYDADDRIVRVEVENIDGSGVLGANPRFTTTTEYDTLDNPIRVTREVDAANDVVTEYEYDDNRNLALVRAPEAVNGSDPDNVIEFRYNERDLEYERIRAPGSCDGAPGYCEESTDRKTYDGADNLVMLVQGLEGTPRTTTWVYDGYDRVVLETDPMGNEVVTEYDANGNTAWTEVRGELIDVAGSAGNQVLSMATLVYDQMDRLVQQDRAFFATATQTPIGDGQSTTTWTYSDASQILTTTNDNGNTRVTEYDTALRVRRTIDPSGNEREMTYDDNGNIVTVVETDRSTSGAADEVFTTNMAYDALDRLVCTSDNVGNQSVVRYDSRDNPDIAIDALGNIVLQTYDGLNRRTVTQRILTEDGTGGGMMSGAIVTTSEYDDNSRLTAVVDDNGNRTEYEYDANDRRIIKRFADGREAEWLYDPHDNPVQRTDANGTVIESMYDLNNRLDRIDVSILTPGVSNETTFTTRQYDGLGRLVSAADDDSLVALEYDSLSNVTRETQNGAPVELIHDGAGNVIECIYPGGRRIGRAYDANERVERIEDLPSGALVAEYEYVGPDRVESRLQGNGVRVEYSYDGVTGVPNAPGDLGVKRIGRVVHRNTQTSQIVGDLRYRYDAMQNTISRNDSRPGPGARYRREFSYDSVYRLARTQIFDRQNALFRDTEYELDGVDNRISVTGGLVPGSYVLDPSLPEPADAQMNQYTQSPLDARIYDANGNLLSRTGPAAVDLTYNIWDVPVGASDGQSVQYDYQYDALGRRSVSDLLMLLFDGGIVCEEQDGLGSTVATYVHGPDSAAPISMRRGGQDYYLLPDALGSVVAATDSSGAVVERYDYGDFGQPLNPSSLIIIGSPTGIANPYLFRGARYDEETALYWSGSMYLDPIVGRTTSRASNLSGRLNATQAFASNPQTANGFNNEYLPPNNIAAGIMMEGAIHLADTPTGPQRRLMVGPGPMPPPGSLPPPGAPMGRLLDPDLANRDASICDFYPDFPGCPPKLNINPDILDDVDRPVWRDPPIINPSANAWEIIPTSLDPNAGNLDNVRFREPSRDVFLLSRGSVRLPYVRIMVPCDRDGDGCYGNMWCSRPIFDWTGRNLFDCTSCDETEEVGINCD